MNEWEWQLLEDKPALDRVTVDGVEFKPAIASGCARARAATSWTSRWPARSRSSRASSRTTKARFKSPIVLEDDPGKDLGLLRQPGHRFFFNVGGDRSRYDASADSDRLHREYLSGRRRLRAKSRAGSRAARCRRTSS